MTKYSCPTNYFVNKMEVKILKALWGAGPDPGAEAEAGPFVRSSREVLQAAADLPRDPGPWPVGDQDQNTPRTPQDFINADQSPGWQPKLHQRRIGGETWRSEKFKFSSLWEGFSVKISTINEGINILYQTDKEIWNSFLDVISSE